ncbi:MAG: T9SS type A sorting domain-containing protein, partial [Bacteroidota bacterium]|nr:T9SS type A sorting domain-containing protein [Bacteroidota bacterium]
SWWGNTYSNQGVYYDTIYNTNSIDSVGILVLEGQDTGVVNLGGTLRSMEGDPNTTYQCVDCGNGFSPISGATQSTFTPLVNGSYAVVLTNGNCVDTTGCISYNMVGLEEKDQGPWLSFYPNPTSEVIHISSRYQLPERLVITDLSGKRVASINISSKHIILPTLAQGVYLLKWIGRDGRVQVDRVMMK